MSVSYTWVGWTRDKKLYDVVMAGLIIGYIGAFFAVSIVALPQAELPSGPILLMRALGTCALLMLHIVLWIGPLARLDRQFLPLLFNRRHLGVATFLVGLAHAFISLMFYHGFGNTNPVLSLLTANIEFESLTRFPFELLGLGALAILFVMAATSHDFWLRTLSPRGWKWLHMLVYVAYGLLVMHVCLGALQSERSPWLAAALGIGMAVTIGLHITAGTREVHKVAAAAPQAAEFIDIGSVDEIVNNRAKLVCLKGRERIAVFRYDGKVSAVSNVCEHQGGPLGEGKVVDGCITCPWHGWQLQAGRWLFSSALQ